MLTMLRKSVWADTSCKGPKCLAEWQIQNFCIQGDPKK